MKTHEAEYQNSATSLALYRRALAALGSPEAPALGSPENPGLTSSPITEDPESPGELIEEDNEEDEEPVVHGMVPGSNPASPKLPNSSNNSMDISNAATRLTVTV